MRIKNSMRNMIYVYASTLVLAILNLVVRRFFLDVLTVDYLGYDGLFTSIFSFLNLSEMGIASIITYHMYSEIASNNTLQIRKLLCIYKTIYRIVGLFVLAMGMIVSLFIPFILKNSKANDSWLFIYTIYFLQLLATLCTYFLAYRRILFITHQRIYVCTVVDTTINLITIVLKMLVLLYTRNYILYLLVSIANNVITNTIIAVKSRKEYPEITPISVGKEDYKALNLFHDVKNMMATKIAGTIYGSSDDIVITLILGIGSNGLINNYRMISAKLQELILSIFTSLQASIGNLVYDDDKDKSVAFFKCLDLAGFLMGLVSATGVITVGQQFIVLWLKKDEFLLPYSFLILLAVNIFIAICNNPMNYFRNSFGHFETDRNYMIAAALVNVILSVLLCRPLGLTGIMIGTVAGHLLIFAGRTIVVYKYFINDTPFKYLLIFIKRCVLLAIAAAFSVMMSKLIYSYIGSKLVAFILSGLGSVIIAGLCFVVTNFRNPAFKTLGSYIGKVGTVIKEKLGK